MAGDKIVDFRCAKVHLKLIDFSLKATNILQAYMGEREQGSVIFWVAGHSFETGTAREIHPTRTNN